MSKSQRCAYCDQVGPATREHVFPDCLQKDLDLITSVKTALGEKPIASAQEVRDVCALCNNVRLSPLDSYLCELNTRYFSKVVRPGDSTRFRYDFDLLLRTLLKIGYNVARARNWPRICWQDASKYIIGEDTRPEGFRVFLQLLVPTPARNSEFNVPTGTKEIGPIPYYADLKSMKESSGFDLYYSLCFWSYRFHILHEAPTTRGNGRRKLRQWRHDVKGAHELTERGFGLVYASSMTVLEAYSASPVFREQVRKATQLKSSIASRKG